MLLSATLGVVGGALAARLAGIQIYLIPASALFLGLGFFLAYGRGIGGRRDRLILWIALGVSLVFWLTPILFPLLLELKGN